MEVQKKQKIILTKKNKPIDESHKEENNIFLKKNMKNSCLNK